MAHGWVCALDDEQAEVYEEAFLVRDWVYREVELNARSSVLNTSTEFLGGPTLTAILDQSKITTKFSCDGEFVSRACHDGQIEVYNPRLDRWEAEKLFDLVASLPLEFEQMVVFTHARQIRRVRMGFGSYPHRTTLSQSA
jgi:hypothetical protein